LPNRKKIWERFENIFTTVDRLYKHRPTYCAFHKRLLEELCEDNIIYAEIRASLSPVSNHYKGTSYQPFMPSYITFNPSITLMLILFQLYDENNRTLSTLEVANELERIVEEFKAKHHDFVGVKVIYAKRNKASEEEMLRRITTFKQLQ